LRLALQAAVTLLQGRVAASHRGQRLHRSRGREGSSLVVSSHRTSSRLFSSHQRCAVQVRGREWAAGAFELVGVCISSFFDKSGAACSPSSHTVRETGMPGSSMALLLPSSSTFLAPSSTFLAPSCHLPSTFLHIPATFLDLPSTFLHLPILVDMAVCSHFCWHDFC
jgi:hypothetical protein